MIEFGIPEMDRAFKDVDHGIILVEGSAGCGKIVLGYHLINKALSSGGKVVAAASTKSPEEKIKELNYYSMKTEPITWIDTTGVSGKDSKTIHTNLGELFTVSAAIKKELGTGDTTIFADVLSSALMSNEPKQVYSFFDSLSKEVNSAGAACYLPIEKDMHDPKDLASLEHLAGIVLEFVVTSEKNGVVSGIIIKKKGALPTPKNQFHFRLTEKGIEIVD